MLFEKTLRRELSGLAGVVFATLFTIFLTTTLVRTLGRAAVGKVDTASVLPLLAYSAIGFLPVLLVLTLFLATLLALTRAWRDSEMVVWLSVGQGLTAWIRPVLRFAAPYVAIIAAVSFFVAPWASREANELRQRFAQREDVSQVAAGQFRESASNNRVFFVESVDEKGAQVGNVFVAQRKDDRLTIVAADTGRVVSEPSGRFLVLEHGRRYDGRETPDGPEKLDVLEFGRYGVRLEPPRQGSSDGSTRSLDVLALVADPSARNLGELASRLGQPISAVLVVLLAMPLSFVNPRAGRSVNLLIALFAYFTYTNLQSVAQAWIAQGKLPFAVGVWVVHVAVAAVVAVLFVRRLRP